MAQALPPSQPQNISAAEELASVQLRQELRRHLDLAGRLFNVVSDVTVALPNPIPDPGQALRAAVLLVLRLANDLRATQIVAVRGYPSQALGLVASMYEVAHTIGYIGTDEDVAQQWYDHKDPTHPFRSVADLTLCSLCKLGAADVREVAEHHHRRYTQLCWGKHAWPQLEQTLSIRETPSGESVVVYGPNITDYAVRALWFAVENAAWCAHVGIQSVIYFHLKGRVQPSLTDQMNGIAIEYKSLRDAYVARWSNVDPFPGQWRSFR